MAQRRRPFARGVVRAPQRLELRPRLLVAAFGEALERPAIPPEATLRELDRCVDVSRSRFAERRPLHLDPLIKPELRDQLLRVLEGRFAAVREVAHGPPGPTTVVVDDIEAQRRRGRGAADVEAATYVGESRAGVADRVERRLALLADGLADGAALPLKIESERRRRRRVRV